MLLIALIALIVSYFIRDRRAAILVTLIVSLGLGYLQVWFLMEQDRTFNRPVRSMEPLGVLFQSALIVAIAWAIHRYKYGKSGDKFDIEGEELRRELARQNQAVGAGSGQDESWKKM